VSFTVVIPARHGAERLPGKPLADIGGRPLIQWVYQAAAAAGPEAVWVATDDPRIQAVVEGFGGRAMLTGAQHASGTDRVAEAAVRLGLAPEAVVVNLQGDEPLMPPALIRRVAETLEAAAWAGAATAAAPLAGDDELNDPDVVKVVCDQRGAALYFSRAPIPWDRDGGGGAGGAARRHIGLYAYRVALLGRFSAWPVSPLEALERLEQLRLLHHGVEIAVCEAAEAPPPGVDSPADLERVRRLLDGG